MSRIVLCVLPWPLPSCLKSLLPLSLVPGEVCLLAFVHVSWWRMASSRLRNVIWPFCSQTFALRYPQQDAFSTSGSALGPVFKTLHFLELGCATWTVKYNNEQKTKPPQSSFNVVSSSLSWERAPGGHFRVLPQYFKLLNLRSIFSSTLYYQRKGEKEDM